MKTSHFFNRELSWLRFNTRVLEEAENNALPLLERVKFLSISASNLDEFFMVRVAGLKGQVRHNIAKKSQDGLTAVQQLQALFSYSGDLVKRQEKSWEMLHALLIKNGLEVVSRASLSADELRFLRDHFVQNIFPALSPIAVDPAHPFPFLPNLGSALVFQLGGRKEDDTTMAVIPLPSKLSRFVPLEGEGLRFVLLEEVIALCQDMIFPDRDIETAGHIRITRDSELEIEDDADDLVSHFETAVKRRRRGSVIRLEVNHAVTKAMQQFLIKEFELSSDDVVKNDGFLDLSALSTLYDQGPETLKFEPYFERSPERIDDFGGDCFAAIAHKDIVVHHPYETFDVVVNFLEQAARDPDVVAIKQTLYRTSKDSPIVKALIEAAEAGKSVTVVVELQARFDEEANIRWARDLERVGAQVVFGLPSLKTHAKVSLVVRKEKNKLVSYVHFGTGNYHPVTARVYVDLSFFTCDKALCRDGAYVFNYLTGYSPAKEFEKLSLAPFAMRDKILSLIDNEIAFAKAGKPATIWAKMNALIDPQVIEKLYEASQAGVKISLVVRGICSLRPGVKGLSETITVKSIIGRFLEHTRIFCFGAGHRVPSLQAKLFISSADWMVRNFEKRVEILVPITNPTVHEQILDQILKANIEDECNSWLLDSEGEYHRVKADKGAFSAHHYFMTNPSLSGRGKALTQE